MQTDGHSEAGRERERKSHDGRETLFSFEQTVPIPVEVEEGKLVGRLDEIQWKTMVLLAEQISNWLKQLPGNENIKISCEPFEKIHESFIWPGISVQVDGAETNVDEAMKKKMVTVASNLVHRVVTKSPHQVDAYSNFPMLDEQTEKLISLASTNILEGIGSKRINSPVRFVSQSANFECKGSFAPKPAKEISRPTCIEVVAVIDGFRLAERKMFLVGDKIECKVVFFEADKFKGKVKECAGDSFEYKLLVVKGDDLNGATTYTLVSIGEKINTAPELFD